MCVTTALWRPCSARRFVLLLTDRRASEQHLRVAGLMQADAYAGFNKLYDSSVSPARSPRSPVGLMHGATSSISLVSPRHRSPSRPSNASTISSPSSVRSTAVSPQRGNVRNERSRPLMMELEIW